MGLTRKTPSDKDPDHMCSSAKRPLRDLIGPTTESDVCLLAFRRACTMKVPDAAAAASQPAVQVQRRKLTKLLCANRGVCVCLQPARLHFDVDR